MKIAHVFFIGCLFGQGIAQETVSSRFSHDVSRTTHGSLHVMSRPFHWDTEDLLYFGVATGGAFTLYLIEQDIRKIFLNNRSPFADSMGEIGDLYGEPITVVLLTGCIYGYGLFFDNTRMRDTAVLMSASLVPAGFIQTLSKTAAGRARPSTDDHNNIFKPFNRTEEYYSFVSGHTLVAMSISLVLARQVNSIPLKIGFYTLGILGGVSRIYNDDHWASDVFLGAALSYASVNTAASWLENNQKTSAHTKNILLHVSPTTVSLSLIW